MLNPMRCGCVMAASSEGWTSVRRCPAHSRMSLVVKNDGSTAVVEGSRVIERMEPGEPLPRDPCWRHYYEDPTLRCTCGSR